MSTNSKIVIAVVVLFAVILSGVGGLVWWTSQSSETTQVLAALVEQTPTPTPAATATPAPTKLTRAQRRAQLQALRLRRQQGVGLFGVINKIDGQTVSVTSTRGADRTFTIGEQTKLILVGKANATVSDLADGDKVLALGMRTKGETNATFTPRVVLAAPSTYNRENVIVGRIETVSANQLQIKTKNGDETVTVSADTQIFIPTLVSGTTADLKAKAPVILLGTPSGTDGFNAQVIISLKPKGNHPGKNGTRKTPKIKPTPGAV